MHLLLCVFRASSITHHKCCAFSRAPMFNPRTTLDCALTSSMACVKHSVLLGSSHAAAGAQALVAWTLSRAVPGSTVSMVAEEDSADLRAPEGKAMLERITQLVNTVLAGVKGSPQITEQELISLIGRQPQPLHACCM